MCAALLLLVRLQTTNKGGVLRPWSHGKQPSNQTQNSTQTNEAGNVYHVTSCSQAWQCSLNGS